MKTKLILIVFLLVPFSFFLSLCKSQVPQGFNYQAIARDGSGNAIVGGTIDVRLDLQADTSTTPVILWEELHSGIKTNAFGLFTVILGQGTRITGTALTFNDVNWSVMPLYIRTRITYQSVERYMGSAKLWSVPYALVANDLGGPVKKLAVTGTTSVMDEALFEVKNKGGQTVFAVYNEGVRVYVSDGLAKGRKGGFAIGSFGSDKAISQPLLIVDPDSIRAYIAPNSLKGLKGGFAIGGFDPTKTAVGEEYLVVTRDSSRIYVKETAKGLKGGFAIGSFNPLKGGPATSFTSLTADNYLIGHNSGTAITTGKYNSFLGYETGKENITGGYNTILGYQSGLKNNSDFNVFLGYQSGYNNVGGSSNTFLGHVAGYKNSSGNSNVFLGDSSGYNNLTGLQNIFLGNGSGKLNNGDYNAFIGYQAGYKNTSGTNNSFIGYQAGRGNNAGKNNIFIGYKAGYSNYGDGSVFNGNSNVYIGDQSGLSNVNGYSNVYIGQEAGKSITTNLVNPPVNNVYIGYQSGYKEYEGTFNTFIGYQTGFENLSGNWDTFIGFMAGYKNTTGSANMFIGYQSGFSNTTGLYNVFNGYQTGRSNSSGYSNTYIGFRSGYTNSTGRYNIAIGNYAGYFETGSRRFYLSVNKGTSLSQGIDSSLIYGEFDNQIIRLNKIVGIGLTPTVTSQALEVSGNGRFTALAGTGNRALYVDPNGILTTSTSDLRLKENIKPINGALEKVLKLQGVTYSLKSDVSHIQNIGFIAQEVEQILPELVFTDPASGLKGINYAEITAVLAESIKAQQRIISEQQEQINSIKALNDSYGKRIQLLENVILELQASNSKNISQK